MIILGERYWVYPQIFTEFLVRHMVAHVSGVPDREAAEDKLRGHFNETRKKAKREQMVMKTPEESSPFPRSIYCRFRYRRGSRRKPTKRSPFLSSATRTPPVNSSRSPRNPRCAPLPMPTRVRWKPFEPGRQTSWRGCSLSWKGPSTLSILRWVSPRFP